MDGALQAQLHRRGPAGVLCRLWQWSSQRADEVGSSENSGEESGAFKRLSQRDSGSQRGLPCRLYGLLPQHQAVQLYLRLNVKPGLDQRSLSPCVPGTCLSDIHPELLYTLSQHLNLGKMRTKLPRKISSWGSWYNFCHFCNSSACTSYGLDCILPLWSHKRW